MTLQAVPLGRVLSTLRQAVSQAETVDVLLRKTLGILNAVYSCDCILWTGFDEGDPDICQVYSTGQRWQAFIHSCSQDIGGAEDTTADSATQPSGVIRRFRPKAIPSWLAALRDQPQPCCLETGDVAIPICDYPPLSIASQTAAQLNAETMEDSVADGASQRPFSSAPISQGTLQIVLQVQQQQHLDGWPDDEVNDLQTIGYHLLMACDSLALKRRLDQSQRHASLLSRTAHVLNTSVNLDRAIQGVLAEMGQSMRCDRLVLFDLRQQSVAMLASWERPRQRLASVNPGTLTYALWQDTIDLFLQGGASYVEFCLTEPDADPLQAWLSQLGVGSALLLPVFIREDFFGAIALLSGRHGRHYSLDELQMARQNTDQLSIALAMIQSSRASTLANPATAHYPTATTAPIDPFTDPVTNLPNADAFERELDTLSQPSAWAFRPPFSLIVCDVDYFKLVNDNHGVNVGDRVLQRIAQKLQHQLRRDTTIYRYGGEEFAIILQETDLQTAKEVAERLRQAVRSMPMRTSSDVLTVTLSFGVAQLTEGDRHALDVLRRAEQALFEAKRQGRDRVATR